MPELPEVESLKNYLSGQVIGRTITSFNSTWPKAIGSHSLSDFTEIITQQVISDIKRHGKYLVFQLLSGQNLLIHLRLTGHLDFTLNSTTPLRYTRHTFGVDNEFEMRLRDVRKFATISLTENPMDMLKNIGKDPLNTLFTTAYLEELLGNHDIPIKSFLLNQSIIAGIGNIYSDEILFASKIHPSTPSSSIPKTMVKILHKTMRTILINATESLTTQIFRDQEQPEWNASSPSFVVPRKAGLPCPQCKKPIEKITFGGRSAYFCAPCQPINESAHC